MVRMKGTYLRFRSVKSSGVNPLILRKRKIVSVGIRIVKQYTTPNTINLYCRGMIRRYENTNRIRNAMKGMENGVNIIEITLAVLIRFLSAIICCSIAIFLFLHYHSTVWIALCISKIRFSKTLFQLLRIFLFFHPLHNNFRWTNSGKHPPGKTSSGKLFKQTI